VYGIAGLDGSKCSCVDPGNANCAVRSTNSVLSSNDFGVVPPRTECVVTNLTVLSAHSMQTE